MTTDAEIVVGIKGDTRGGKTVQRSLDDIAKSGERVEKGQKELQRELRKTSSAGQQLTRALKGVVAAYGLRELQQVVDTYTNIQNRLKLVTNGTDELKAVTRELFTIANETRLSFEGTAEVYARTALATKELGLSQRQTLDFTKSLNQAVVLSGASAMEAQAGMIQLSQGLASGTLRGDELRSVLEQLPAVADVIAKGLGVTRGELRKMGEQGEITAKQVISAFEDAREELNEKFAKTVPTIGQAFTVLKNNIIELVGEMDELTGASAKVAKGILFIGKHLPELTKLILAAAGAWLIFRTQALLATGATVIASFVRITAVMVSITGVMGSLTLAAGAFVGLLTGPVGIAVALAAVGVAAFTFRDELNIGVTSVLTEIIILADKAASGLNKLFGGAGGNLSGLTPDELRNSVDELRKELAPSIDPEVSDEGGKDKTPPVISKAQENAQKELAKLIKKTSTEQETLLNRIKELQGLRAFADTAEELQAIDRALEVANDQLLTASDIIPGMNDDIDDMAKAMDRFADTTADAFTEFVTGAATAKEALMSVLDSLIKMTFEQTVSNPLSGFLGSVLEAGIGGIFGGTPTAASSFATASARGAANPALFGPGFAHGGSMVLGGNSGVDQNQLSLNGAPIARVGRGETLSVNPNNAGSGGPSIVVNQNINVSTGVQETVAAEMQTFIPEIKEATVAAVRESNLRGVV